MWVRVVSKISELSKMLAVQSKHALVFVIISLSFLASVLHTFDLWKAGRFRARLLSKTLKLLDSRQNIQLLTRE